MDNTTFSVRKWSGIAIARRSTDGYVNATAMCKAGDRRWFNYVRADRTSDYISALAGSTQIRADLLVCTVTTGPNHLRGTWIHPRLAVDLARWISPAFAVWMDGWILDELQGVKPQQLTGTAALLDQLLSEVINYESGQGSPDAWQTICVGLWWAIKALDKREPSERLWWAQQLVAEHTKALRGR